MVNNISIKKPMPKKVYVCYFLFKGKEYETFSKSSISNFKYGFWVTEELKFTTGSNSTYWIPPSQILYIEKASSFEKGLK